MIFYELLWKYENKKKGDVMKNQQIDSVQNWLPYRKIFDRGVIKLKDSSYIKIIQIIPINFNLKSDLEKQAILNSYKVFLKTCNFDIQILIQSNKEDLSKHISKIKEQNKKENNFNISEISKKYISFIQKINQEKKSSSKNFYIIIKEEPKQMNLETDNIEEIIIEQLNEKFFKIKECLSRCGNTVFELGEKEETRKILFSFLNSRIYLNN